MKYTESHEWVRVEKEKARVGLSLHAQREIGEIVYIEFPQVGEEIQAQEQVVVLESTKAAIDIYSPVSGKVIGINERLKETPSLLNEDPEGEGYLFEIMLTDVQELDCLISKDVYDQKVAK